METPCLNEYEFQILFNNIDYSQIMNSSPELFKIPENNIKSSRLFIEWCNGVDKIWDRNSKDRIKTYIDHIFIDVLYNQKTINKYNKNLILVKINNFQEAMDPWELFSMMAQEQKNQNKIIYGIMTDSQRYYFYRLDLNFKILRSKSYDFSIDKVKIWNFIDFLINTTENPYPTYIS